MKTDRKTIEADILSLLTEDYIASYEVTWSIRSMAPCLSNDDAAGMAEDIIRLFWERGWIKLVERLPNEAYEEVRADTIDEIFRSHPDWAAEDYNRCLWIITTREGDMEYFGKPISRN